MKIDREDLLNQLQMVQPGLSSREFVTQSSCYVFMDGRVHTFNDEILCSIKTEIDQDGAVQASTLVTILDRLKEDKELAFRINEQGEMHFRGKQDEFGITRDPEILLPTERVEDAAKMYDIPEGLIAAMKRVACCVSRDQSLFKLTCIHLHPEYIEACDNFQAMRVYLDTGLEEPVIVRGSSLQPMFGLGMTRMSQSKTWLHFKNAKGLTYSCRQYAEEYHDISEFMKVEGKTIILPKGVSDITQRATVFSSDRAGEPLVAVRLLRDRVLVTGRGYGGWYRAFRDVEYAGPFFSFLIAPDIFQSVCENYSTAQISESKLKSKGEHEGHRWVYVTVLEPTDPVESGTTSVEKESPTNKKDPTRASGKQQEDESS